MIHSIVHIVDDAAWGGVNRLLAGLENSDPALVPDTHRVIRVTRGTVRAPTIQADVIVSHMSVCWANVPFFSSLRGQNPDTPLVHVEHSYSEHFAALNVGNRTRFDDLLSLSYALFDRVVAVSEPQAAWLLRRRHCLADQLVTIPACVPLDPFRAVAARRAEGSITVGAIGRFHTQKGFDILVDAFTRLDPADMRLVLVGDGEDEARLRQMAQGRGNIVFAGRMDDPAEAYAMCDVVALPSRWEPYGLVALEAMAARRPVLCSAVDGLRQHITTGATAVAGNTPVGWAGVLSRLTTREAIAALPIGNAADGAERRFAQGWKGLVAALRDQPGAEQMAA